MAREWVAEESVLVEAPVDRAYEAVADPRRMTEWSPELFAVWIRRAGRGPVASGTRFVGFNRIGARVWFTGCRVTAARPGETFAFRVSSFGVPVALWGYRFEAVGGGRTRLTEYWEDLRRDHRGTGFISALGTLFTGVSAEGRAEVNRCGMRATLGRIKSTLEQR